MNCVEVNLSWAETLALSSLYPCALTGGVLSIEHDDTNSVTLPARAIDARAIRDWLHDNEGCLPYQMYGQFEHIEAKSMSSRHVSAIRFQFRDFQAAIYFRMRWQ